MSTNSITLPDARHFPESVLVLVLGAAAAVFAALIGAGHWMFPVFAGLIVFVFSAIESEPFFLAMIFLIPVGWLAKINFPLGGRDARVDFATGARIVLVAGFFAGRIWRGQFSLRKLFGSRIAQLSMLFAVVAVASVLFAPSGVTYGSFKAVIRLFSYIGFFEFILVWANSWERIQTIVLTILSSAILVCVFGIIQEVVGDYTSLWLYLNPPEDWFLPMEHRVPSFLNYSNSLAAYLNLVLPAAMACCAFCRRQWQALGGVVLVLGFVTLLCTQSLGGLAAFGAVVALGILFLIRTWKARILICSCILAIAGCFYVYYEVLNPAHGGVSFGYDQVTRLLLWGVAWNLFTQSPVLGVGWGNFVELYGPYLKDFSFIPAGIFATHNTYLQFLTETGIVGFVTFFVLLFQALRQSIRQFRRPAFAMERVLAFGVIGAIVTLCVHGLVDFFFHVSPQFGTLFWTLMALLVASGDVFESPAYERAM